MSEVEDTGSDVSDLEKDNGIKGNTNLENLQKQRLHLEEQLKEQVQQMTPAKDANKTKVNNNMLSVPARKNKKGKDIESASDMSSAEESEELNTDDSADATNEESENDNLESVKRERRQSNLVRINTQTKWSADEMDALKGELLDQISQMAAQNAQRDGNFDVYPDYHTNHSHAQHTNGQSNGNFEQLNGTTSMQPKIEERNSAPHYVTTNKQGDSWPTLQMTEREKEMLAQIEYLRLQNAQLQAAQNSKDAQIGKANDIAPAQTSSNTTEPQQSIAAYNVKDTKQTNRSHPTQSEIKEPLLESNGSHPNNNSSTCCCAVL